MLGDCTFAICSAAKISRNAVDRNDRQTVNLLELLEQIVGLEERIDLLPAEVHRRRNRPDLAAVAGKVNLGFRAVLLSRAWQPTSRRDQQQIPQRCSASFSSLHP